MNIFTKHWFFDYFNLFLNKLLWNLVPYSGLKEVKKNEDTINLVYLANIKYWFGFVF